MSDIITPEFLGYDEFSALYRRVLAETEGQKLFDGELYEHFSSDFVTEKLYKISQKLVENAKKFNLTSILEPHEIVRKHLVDSILPLGIMAEHGLVGEDKKVTLADIGCGAGFPSLPMAASSAEYFPIFFMGIDSTAKKITHIKESAEYAGLNNIDALAGRAEELTVFTGDTKAQSGSKSDSKSDSKKGKYSEKRAVKNARKADTGGEKAPYFRERFDITTARAVASLAVLCELTAPMTKVGGHFCALKSHADEEIEEAKNAPTLLGLTLCDRIDYELPGGDKRVMLIYEKVAHTPGKYPRRYSEITKQPLK